MIKDAIYGFIIGDALGVPYEFNNRGMFKCTDMIGHGTWDQPVGTWSDDSSMTLATLDSIKKTGKINLNDMRKRFEDWAFNGAYTANGNVFDIGTTTYRALNEKRGIDDILSNGNGSLMRILPLAFIESTEKQIASVSAITHGHDISKLACRIYVHIAKQILKGKTLEEILPKLTFVITNTVFERLTSIGELPESEIKSTGYVVDTLEAVLWCLCNTDNYKDAVLKAVNLGGDTDTIAAITGGLAGIMYGYKSIPKEWIDKLRNKELIESII